MRATLLLCDHAAVADGKLYVSGGGWSIVSPNVTGYIALLLAVPWDLANHQVEFEFVLFDEDGDPVTTMDPGGNNVPLRIGARLEVGRPPGLVRGVSLDVPLAIALPPVVLPPGRRFEWVLTVNGESKEEWRLPFLVVPPPG